jgi:hypothetical protein
LVAIEGVLANESRASQGLEVFAFFCCKTWQVAFIEIPHCLVYSPVLRQGLNPGRLTKDPRRSEQMLTLLLNSRKARGERCPDVKQKLVSHRLERGDWIPYYISHTNPEVAQEGAWE